MCQHEIATSAGGLIAAPLCATAPGTQFVAVPCPAPATWPVAPAPVKAPVIDEATAAFRVQCPQGWIPAPNCLIGLGATQPLPLAGIAAIAAVQTANAGMTAVWAPAPAAVSVIAPPPAPATVKLQSAQEAPTVGEALADAPKLTRGARRHLKQRLRKKTGKLERMRAAAGVAPLASTPLSQSQGEDVPICMVDGLQQGSLDATLFAIAVPQLGMSGTKQLVPVCAVQSDSPVHEDSDLEVIDASVALPCVCKREGVNSGMKAAEVAKAGDGHAESGAIRPSVERSEYVPVAAQKPTTRRSTTRMATWPLRPQAHIPTANTFVHFPVEREQPRRRSRSV
uniref:Uncharacterized protein n=1 Tax=Alexandrium andersonii TaxID=327968 RepID=A0A7S2EZD6_9DINO